MTISISSPTSWTAQSSLAANHSRRPRHGGTEFDQQLQTPQAQQSAQAGASSSSSPLSAAASLPADLLHTIANHVSSALSSIATKS